MYKRILVGYDGSEGGERALSRAVSLAKSFGSELCLLTVIPPSSMAFGEIVVPDAINLSLIIESSRKRLADIASRLSQEGLKVRYDVLTGDPGDVIVSYAEANSCDLIVLGRRRLSRLERLVLGSVTHKVAGKATKCDVLVVP